MQASVTTSEAPTSVRPLVNPSHNCSSWINVQNQRKACSLCTLYAEFPFTPTGVEKAIIERQNRTNSFILIRLNLGRLIEL